MNYLLILFPGRPQIATAINQYFDISSTTAYPYTIPYGSVSGFKTIEWYTNGERIKPINNYLLTIDGSNNLKVLRASPSLFGIFQIFYSNDAGNTSQSFILRVTSGIYCHYFASWISFFGYHVDHYSGIMLKLITNLEPLQS